MSNSASHMVFPDDWREDGKAEDAWGSVGPPVKCDECRTTGVSWGETCTLCGGRGWLADLSEENLWP